MTTRILFSILLMLLVFSVCNIYAICLTGNIGLGYFVYNTYGLPALSFTVNFASNMCMTKIIYGWSWGNYGTIMNVTASHAPYFHNITISPYYFMNLGIWTAGANITIYEITIDKIALVVWRDDSAVSRVLATHELPDIWSKILSRGIAYVALWLPNVTWQNIHVYVNGSIWDGYMTDCVRVLQLSDTPAVCFDRNYHIVVLRLPMHSRYVVTIDEATAEVTPTPKSIEVTSVTLTFTKTEVKVNELVTYTVTVQVNDTTWSGTLDYTLVCTGPTTVKDTGTIQVSAGSGTATGTVTFPEAGTYTCSAVVNGKESNIVQVRVVERKVELTPIIITLVLVILIALVVVYELEKRKRTGTERGVVVRIRL